MNEHERDDEAWLALLAGRRAPEALAATRHEAAWMRAALLAYRAQAPAGGPAPAEQRVQRLLARAREAGVLAPARPAAAPALPWHRRLAALFTGPALGPLGLGLAALLMSAVLLLPGVREPGTGAPLTEEALRGPALQRVVTPEPRARRDAMLQALQAAGLDARAFERLGRPGLDVALPVPLPEAQARALHAQGLQVPGGPVLQVEFVGPGTP